MNFSGFEHQFKEGKEPTINTAKQIKASELPSPRQGAAELIRRAHQKPDGSIWPTTPTEELIEWNAMDVVSITMVYTVKDMVESKRSFKPKLAHQIFGQKEKMCGYLFPKIRLYILANSARCFLKFTHEGICSRQADNINVKIFDNLISWLPEDYFTDETRFIQELNNEHHTMFGKTIFECELYNYKENNRSKFVMRECSVDEPGFSEFHNGFQCLIVWYIDAASQLDLEDPNWLFIYVYEKMYMPDRNQFGYFPVGFSAVYKFFHYPDKIRVRISQCFILPCFQRMGIGFKLLTATYQAIASLPNVVDITVEDPCPAFQRLRDTVDSTLVRQLESFKYPIISKGFTKKMMDDANNEYKINKRQCRRVHHILRMGYALLSGKKEESESLIKDIQCFLGVQQQATATKMVSENGSLKNVTDVSREGNITAAVEKYTNEIRPIAWRLSKLLRDDNI